MVNKTLLRDVLIVCAVIAGLGGAGSLFRMYGAAWMPIKYVRVEGAFQYIAKEQIKRVLDEPVQQGFLQIDMLRLDEALRTLPWVDRATVQRVWPDAIKVMVLEQTPVARWNGDQLLNDKGELFAPDNIADFTRLPLIMGPQGQEKKLLEIQKGLRLALLDHTLVLRTFQVDNRRAWTLRLANDLEIKLGRDEQLEKIQQFLKTVNLLGQELLANARTVDLRYPNGYAINWKTDRDEMNKKLMVVANHSRV